MTTFSEKLLYLSDGRILAYAENGNTNSSTMVIFLHGLFGVGRCDRVSAGQREADVHVVNPTLPGFGNSSPIPTSSYAVGLAKAMNELIDHLHPKDPNLKIYIAGGSYGTVPAQILYGVGFDIFPHGRNIKGCLLLAPFSPPRWHKEYTRCMTWRDYIGVGLPSQLIPFRLLPRMLSFIVGRMMFTSVDKTETILRQAFFDNVSDEEKAAAAKWREEQGLSPGQFEREMAENAMKSFSKTWIGYMEASDVLHSDWLFKPDELDEEHSKRHIIIVPSSQDELGPGMAKWLADNYKNSTLRIVHGSHIAALYEMDDIWKQLMQR